MNQGMKTFRRLYLSVLDNDTLKAKYANVLSRFRHERDKALSDFADNAESLRMQGSEIRDYSVAHMPELVEELSANFTENGGKVVFAKTGKEAADQIHKIIKNHKAKTVIKTKSMMTEEIRLNYLLEADGITIFETDLGEFIVQLAGDKPAHIIAPALHKDRHDVSKLFVEKLGAEPTDNIETLTRIARENLREVFKNADVGITGANFLVAETGSACIVTNEGNGRICTTLPKILITVAGIDKITAKFSDLAVLQPLLMRFATGQRFTSYLQILSRPAKSSDEEGPDEHYLVLVDNGRFRLNRDEKLREIQKCIRCGACISVCPVYEHIGGHSYMSVYPGPFGSILTPAITSDNNSSELPGCSSLCMRCDEVCPVKIKLSDLLFEHRRRANTKKSGIMNIGMLIFSILLRSKFLFTIGFRTLRLLYKISGNRCKIPWLRSTRKNWTDKCSLNNPE